MIHVKQAIIVEGKYDKIKLTPLIDALIIPTNGFQIYKDKEKLALIRKLAETNGIIILTDSDGAGLQIRSYLKSVIPKGEIINVFIPDIFGKEKRKTKPSKANTLGVEGMPDEIIKQAFLKAGVFSKSVEREFVIDKAMLFDDGFIGTADAAERRKRLQAQLNLPELMSTNALVEVLNSLFTCQEYKQAVDALKSVR